MIPAALPARVSWRHVVGITTGLEGLAVAVWLVPASVYIVNWSASRPSRVALLAPRTRLVWLVAATLAVSAVLIAWSRRAGVGARLSSAVAPVCLLWLWSVPYLPWLPDRVPLVLVLGGPIRWVIAAAALLGVVIGARLDTIVSSFTTLPDRRIVFAFSLALYASLGALHARTVGPGGDEPHYLIISHSLLADGDLRIENNHRQGDYRQFWAGDLRPDYMTRGLNGEIYSIHAPGLPVLLLPAYAVGGYPGTVMVLCLLAALAALAIFDLAEMLAGRRAALVTWAAVCLTVPFVPHSWLVFPEIPGALVVAWAALWLWPRVEQPTINWVWRGLALGALPWLHTKFVILLAIFGAALLWRVRLRPRALVAMLVPMVLSVAGWLYFFYTIYGSINPEAPYGDYAAMYVLWKNIPRGLLGLTVDQKFGLLVYSPIYLFAIAGCWAVLRRPELRSLGAVLLLVIVAYVGSTTRLYMWWGGSSAPARFLVPILPCLAPMIAMAVATAHGRAARTLLWTWLSVSLLIAVVAVVWPERLLLFSDQHGYARLLETIQSGAPLTMSLPTFTNEDWQSPLKELFLWMAAGGLALAALGVAARSRRVSGFWLGVVACLTFLTTAGVAARRPSTEARDDLARQGTLDLLWQYDGGRLRAFEYNRLGKIGADRIRELGLVTFQRYPVVPFSLPEGAYEARVWFSGALRRQGEIVISSDRVTFGRGGGVFTNPGIVPFELHVGVGGLSVGVSDQSLAAAVSRIEIVPTAIVPQSAREPRAPRAIEPLGDRPGAYMVYVDGHAYPEGGVFWTRATELATVLVATGGASRILLTLYLGPESGDVKLSLAGKEGTVRVERGNTAEVLLAVPAGVRIVPITVESTTSFRPSDVNPASDDTRTLGCQVRVRLE